MKFWFAKRSPKDAYDGKAPLDATVEQALRVAREVNSNAPAETEREIFDFAKVFQNNSAPPAAAPQVEDAAPAVLSPPKVSRAMREEMERRIASYRAFQMKLNDEREARIRRTMEDLRAKLQQSATHNPPSQ